MSFGLNFTPIKNRGVRVCECVCACVRDGERERERKGGLRNLGREKEQVSENKATKLSKNNLFRPRK